MYEAEATRALDGAWVGPAIHKLDKVQFRVRAWANPEFITLRDRLMASVPRDKRTPDGDIPADEVHRIHTECLLQTVLLDWRGLEATKNGPPVVYTADKARELLTHPKIGSAFSPFRQAIVASATQVAKEGREQLEEEIKNSNEPSAGA
jgi:hypothetical protein